MKQRWLMVVVALLLVVLAACGNKETASNGASGKNDEKKTEQAEEMTIKHQLGEAKVKKNPEKVVVFDFGVLDTLDKLGVKVTALPQMNVPKYLEKYKSSDYQNVGSLKEPDFEKLSEIKPDVIFISGRQAHLYDKLKEIGPTVYIGIDTQHYWDSFTNNMKLIGQMFGKEKEVDEELANIEKQIEEVKTKAADKKALIILTTGGKVSAYSKGSRFGLIHDVLGVPAADPNLKVTNPHGQSVSFEYIAEKNPDYLFVIDRDAVVEGKPTAKQTIENALVKKTKAYQNGHIVYLDPNYWYLSGGGLTSVSEMIKQVEEGLK
ncbi:siderophore ABC transporter substrate-binding protein [Geobacillus sp. FSL K6-0789]|uniref:Iron compound ABC uptake transporter substrate-binding protein n=1 Tax=Geobacillus stearothermophilus TaxID=1422 RepID=A0A0K9HDL9_GEOSE|nr:MULTISPECIES: siderophore ABC transporter substrate-binding protein [Geobacillus]KAF6511346.1 putative iron compound ABC uptake transporter substrate-binding protein [Geobacillus stearothermophilus]KMY56657.1 ABC transporter [Geobacillus stearothermophilus]KMY61248.1 ABC transporter [Geobacillus stearothermophilus]KMY64900.1 ABC transporter [Geobacillus stearothermophilus]MBR2516740.1 siderophore ABC transporter substrate-binding protein [Geobacillus sp.]